MPWKPIPGRAAATTRILIRGLPAAVVLGTVLMLSTGCGSGEPSLQHGRATASEARGPVDQEYKNVSTALQSVSEQDLDFRTGYTRACPAAAGEPADQVSYDVINVVNARNYRLSALQLLPLLEESLKTKGRKGFAPGYGPLGGGFTPASRYWASRKDQFEVVLQPGRGNQARFMSLAMIGSCVTVGHDFVVTVPLVTEQPTG